MANLKYDKEITALLVIDPYNDFISEGGKVWGRLKTVAEANDCIPHMAQALNAARRAELRVFYAPHRRYRPGDYETWKYIALTRACQRRRTVPSCSDDVSRPTVPSAHGHLWWPNYHFVCNRLHGGGGGSRIVATH